MIRTAIIGTGLMGQRLLGDLARHSEFETVAGFDLDAQALRAASFNSKRPRVPPNYWGATT